MLNNYHQSSLSVQKLEYIATFTFNTDKVLELQKVGG